MHFRGTPTVQIKYPIKEQQRRLNWTASSPFLDSREGARNNQAEKPKSTESEQAEAPSPQSLLVYFSSLQSRRAVRFRLASPLDYPERDC